MDTNMVLNASFNELVFENRHKDYGAYQIRKRYSKNVLLAGLLAVSIFAVAMGSYFINMPDANAAVIPIVPKQDTHIIQLMRDNEKDKQKEKIEPKPQPQKGSSNTITTNIVITMDSVLPMNPNDTAGSSKGIAGGTGKIEDTIRTTGGGTPCLDCPDTTKPTLVKWLINPPKDPGLDEFFRKNIHYPQIAKDQGIEGVVYLTFVVDTKGDVRDIAILKGAHPLLDREVLRVAKFMPKWDPVIGDDGHVVEYQYSKPVRFKLAK